MYEQLILHLESLIQKNVNNQRPTGLVITNCKKVIIKDSVIDGFDNPYTITGSDSVDYENNIVRISPDSQLILLLQELVKTLKETPNDTSKKLNTLTKLKEIIKPMSGGISWLMQISNTCGISII